MTTKTSNRSPRALFINPWITDVAAYDLWARPLGLLYLAGLLRARGWEVGLIDCMDRRHPSLKAQVAAPSFAGTRRGRDDGHGCGQYRSQTLAPVPDCLRTIHRRYARYGISTGAFEDDAARLGPPDLIVVTTRMTYWYPGADMAVRRLRALFPSVPLAVGGVYATLCPDHARRVLAPDYLVAGEGENDLLALAAAIAPGRFDATPLDPARLDDLPAPAWDLSAMRSWPAVAASRGCPMRCAYCASGRLYRAYRRRDPGRVAEEILRLARDQGATDVAFYDDALIDGPAGSFARLLDHLIEAGAPVRLHTPNGVAFAHIDEPMAQRMRAAGVQTVRISLESADPGRLAGLNRPADIGPFDRAMQALRRAGYSSGQIGVYLLAALPGQSEDEVRRSIDRVLDAGGTPLVGEYSPIPGTPEFDHARADSGLPLDDEPLLHNNSVFHRLAPWSRDGLIDRLRRYSKRQA